MKNKNSRDAKRPGSVLLKLVRKQVSCLHCHLVASSLPQKESHMEISFFHEQRAFLE